MWYRTCKESLYVTIESIAFSMERNSMKGTEIITEQHMTFSRRRECRIRIHPLYNEKNFLHRNTTHGMTGEEPHDPCKTDKMQTSLIIEFTASLTKRTFFTEIQSSRESTHDPLSTDGKHGFLSTAS